MTCSTHGRDMKVTDNLGQELEGKRSLEDRGVYEETILKWMLKMKTTFVWMAVRVGDGLL
jgi:hypothetical protein